MSEYKFLFPYEVIAQNSKILIYGAGDVGVAYLKQMLITGYADVIGFVDKNHTKYSNLAVPVYSPDDLSKLEFDYVVLAFKREDYVSEITDLLSSMGIGKQKIVYKGIRNTNVNIIATEAYCCGNVEYAYHKARISVALKYGTGLGDSIIKKGFFIELTHMLPEAMIDIYSPTGSNYIPAIYGDQENFNCVIDDGGALYSEKKKQYTLAISLFHLIEVDYINYSVLERYNKEFAEKMKRHIKNHREYNLSNFPEPQKWINYSRAKYKGWNCYSIYQYTDVFKVERKRIYIPLAEAFKGEMGRYNKINYITINYGNGRSGKGYKENISKQWPLEYFNEFLYMFKHKFPYLKVIQVGDITTEKLKNVDEYFIDKNLEEVKYVLKGALLHVDIEGGLVHLATNLGTKCIVLFGPTQVDIYGYPENINIVSPECNGCYGLYDNAFRCAKDLDNPECMKTLTPQLVMSHISSYLDNIDLGETTK